MLTLPTVQLPAPVWTALMLAALLKHRYGGIDVAYLTCRDRDLNATKAAFAGA